MKNESFRISQLTTKSTPTVTDANHSLHMLESKDDSDTPSHSNCQRYTTYDIFERKTCVNNTIIENGKSKRQKHCTHPPLLKGLRETHKQ